MVETNEAGRTIPAAGSNKDWRAALNAWLAHNPKTMPVELRRQREAFVARFPKERLATLTLAEYALGTENETDSFCYWLKQETLDLGHVGRFKNNYGVWWSGNEWKWKRASRPEEALARIKGGLMELVKAVEESRYDELDLIGQQRIGPASYSLRGKPLYLYFPDNFLPIWQLGHIAHFLKIFGAEPQGEFLARNRQLLALLRGLPEFAGFDTAQMMHFLYDSFHPTRPDTDETDVAAPMSSSVLSAMPRELAQLMDITARTRNVLLYGPPGTGKTWLVNHFTNYFLLSHNAAGEKADEYWRAVRSDDREQLKALSALAHGRTVDRERQFWWLNANEDEWNWQQLFERGEWCYGKRHPAPNFAAARRGDFIFGYFASPHSQIVCTAYVAGELAWREFDGEPRECILIKPGTWLDRPLDWRTVGENEVLKNSAVIRTNARGSMHALSNAEGLELLRLVNDEGNCTRLPPAQGGYAEFVTFHQSFAYEEFVEGLKPVLSTGDEPGGIKYEIKPGVFRQICARAETDWEADRENAPKYLLVIDEINRANIAKVLGELITLIEDDKRLGEANELRVRLPSSGARFGVPPNLYILGTMNTADRSIALLDLALRRRFTFVEMRPQPSVIEPPVVAGVDLRALLTRLNERIAALRDRDHQIGHSYLLHLTDVSDLHFAWYRRVVPLLQEYFYNDGERLKAVMGGRFVRPVKMGATGAAFKELYDDEQPSYEVVELKGDEFIGALRALAGGAADVEASGTADIEAGGAADIEEAAS